MSPCLEALFGLRMRTSGPGDWGPICSANAVDNLVPTPPSTYSCRVALTAALKSRCRRPQVQPKLPDLELRLRGTCGKVRTRFPQGDAAQPAEIPHPVDPETWKRCYTVIVTCSRPTNETIWCNLYWLDA